MNKKLYISISLFFFILLSCTNNSGKIDKQLAFNSFMYKFKPIDLPLLLMLEDNQLLKNSQAINPNSNDTMFIQPIGNCRAYGYLRDTSRYYALVYVIIGDEPNFKIVTFDKSFNKIAESSLMNSDGCVQGTLCLKCNTSIEFLNNSTIKTIDSLNYLDCDSDGNSTDSIVQRKRLELTIHIDNKGYVKISKE